jgi:hypothetical protein
MHSDNNEWLRIEKDYNFQKNESLKFWGLWEDLEEIKDIFVQNFVSLNNCLCFSFEN